MTVRRYFRGWNWLTWASAIYVAAFVAVAIVLLVKSGG